MFEIYEGRPKDISGLSEMEKRSYDLLDSLKIHYMRTEHPPADNMEICQQRAAVLGTRICKNLFLTNFQETNFYLLMMPADKSFKSSVIAGQLGISRLHFAGEEHMTRLLGLHPGSVSVLGLMCDEENRVQLLMDRDILQQDEFACHPCMNTASIKFRTSELVDSLLPALHHEPIFVTI